VAYLHLPLFTDELGMEQMKEKTLLQLYSLALELYQQQIKAVMSAIAAAKSSILLHCTGGKDRTGLMTALLLALANVPAATIALDYAMSADYLTPLYALQLETARQLGYAHIFESPAETMLETLKYLEQQYGEVVGYLQAIGMTTEQINRLREMLVD
jgi:protein-tyrosine phosphatase